MWRRKRGSNKNGESGRDPAAMEMPPHVYESVDANNENQPAQPCEIPVNIGNHSIKIDSASLSNLPEFLDKIDLILSFTLEGIQLDRSRNPQIDVKLRDLKQIMNNWQRVESGGSNQDQTSDGQIPRGGQVKEKINNFEMLLPNVSKWVDQNIQQ